MARFSEVVNIINGKNQSRVENPNGEYPIYGSGGIMGYADDYICEADTVIIGRKGNINKPIFADKPFWNVDTAFGLSAKKDRLFPKYLFYFCEKYDFEKLNTTVTIPSLTKANLLNIEIPLPPIDEQRRIAAVLDKTAALIDLRKQQLAKLDELVKARFVEMFGDAQNNKFGFKTSTLSDISEQLFAGGDKPSDVSSERTGEYLYPVYANGYENQGLQCYVKNYRVEKQSVTVSARGTIGYCFIRNPYYTPVVRLITIVPKSCISVEYLKYAIDNMEIGSSGSSQQQLTVPDFKKKKLVVPPMELQKQFAEFVKQIDKSKAAIQKSLDEAQLLFDSLMQKHFG